MSTDRSTLNTSQLVTNREVAAFLKRDLSWIPSIINEYRLLIRGDASTDGLTPHQCANQALTLLDQLGHPHPQTVQNQKLLVALALNYTSAGLRHDTGDPDLQRALYLLRAVSALKGGPKHPHWSTGVSAIMMASFHQRVSSRTMSEVELMDHLVRLSWPPDKMSAGLSTFATAREIAFALRNYPPTRDQLNRELEFLRNWYQRNKTWTDLYHRTGQLYSGIRIKRLSQPSRAEPFISAITTIVLWAGIGTACFFLWPRMRILVLAIVGVSMLYWGVRIYRAVRK